MDNGQETLLMHGAQTLQSENVQLRGLVKFLLSRGNELAAVSQSCAHSCYPPCPHTRKVGKALETWQGVAELVEEKLERDEVT